jgi:hypothetical protein
MTVDQVTKIAREIASDILTHLGSAKPAEGEVAWCAAKKVRKLRLTLSEARKVAVALQREMAKPKP